MVAYALGKRDVQMMINDPVVEDDAVDYSDHGIILVYKMFTHNDAQKADDNLQEKSGDTLEQQGVGDDQKDDGKIHHNTVQELNQDKQEDPQMKMSSHNVFTDEQQQAINQYKGRQESERCDVMMTAVGNAQMNVLGWVYEHQLGRRHFEKPTEMIVCVHFVHYDLEYAFPGYAVEDVDEQNQDQSDDNDKHLEEKEDLDRLDGH